jgi:hypothetical protein
MADLRYPIGKFAQESALSPERREECIADIADAPRRLRAGVSGMSPGEFDTPYRPGGWTVRQVVHHLPDSHLNAYIRFKLALTEPEPTIKPYDQESWAQLADTQLTPIEVSLQLLESLHARWTVLLKSLRPEDWARTFRHPELGVVSLESNLAMYAWHGRHHVSHITSLRERLAAR